MNEARAALRASVRACLGFGEQGERAADLVMALFSGVEFRDQDVDITGLGDTRRQLIRQTWIVAALPHGPARRVEGELVGVPTETVTPSG